ncbi:sigma-54-dependent Fis family transcriptional regulator [Geobacter sp. SVR]|uniref:sigma-54 dependent transcriptional regulator n=1 Tax=Geobacter sp. SVR TaxID=2495594 RepID=UPI00143EF880|nr:sigma-54-dependent Fis family transcriptional regulator [Geobacter sp. SVR]BCS53723.1 sigma-54-dependent Fis family transcriptional regulator [Geobacter sp. SVR]GCF85769.1 sigma-54-dependent Fis family transcriptional regulator [Geobacter sp. SVR]
MTNEVLQRILVTDDEEGVRLTLARLLEAEGYRVDTAGSRTETLELLSRNDYAVVFLDIMLGTDNGIDLLREIRGFFPGIQVVMITGRPDVGSAATAVRLGAFDYIVKPVRYETLAAIARHALKSKLLADEQERTRANLNAIFSSVSDAIIMVDNEQRLIQYNSAAAAMCGYHDGQTGCSLMDINFGCGGVCRHALIETMTTGTSQQLDRFECRKAGHGTSRILSFRATPVTEADGTIKGAVAVLRDETRLDALERVLQQRDQFHGLIGRNAGMQKIYSLIEALSDVHTTVLINGESGTGKELVAAALHVSGRRKSGPLVTVNCSALSETLLESELFGHVRGAFTGAIANKAGRFEKANGGTLLLDEIGDISPAMQMRLLRVLQEREVERVGGSAPIKVDVRVIAATNQDLAEKVRQGTFRQDLYFRINVVRLELPPLRDRLDDLPLLAEHFLKTFTCVFGKSIRAFSDDVFALFLRYDWPGNVRQLEHVIEHACILCRSDVITVDDLPQDLRSDVRAITASPVQPAPPSDLGLDEALAMAGGNKSRAARLLGISRRTVYRRLSG